MFPCMVGRASVDVIFSGMAGSRDCALQLVLYCSSLVSNTILFWFFLSFKAST